jgi:hypothetical protein
MTPQGGHARPHVRGIVYVIRQYLQFLSSSFAERRHAKSVLVALAAAMAPYTGRAVMTAIHETAYPWLRSSLSDKELEEVYTPTPDDLAFIHRNPGVPPPLSTLVCGRMQKGRITGSGAPNSHVQSSLTRRINSTTLALTYPPARVSRLVRMPPVARSLPMLTSRPSPAMFNVIMAVVILAALLVTSAQPRTAMPQIGLLEPGHPAVRSHLVEGSGKGCASSATSRTGTLPLRLTMRRGSSIGFPIWRLSWSSARWTSSSRRRRQRSWPRKKRLAPSPSS